MRVQEVSPSIWMNLIGSDDRDSVISARRQINHLFAVHDAAQAKGETSDIITGAGDDIIKLVFFCRENPDVTHAPSPTQKVITTLSGIFSNAGFSICMDEYGLQVEVQNTQSDIQKFRDLSYKIHDEASKQDLQNFTLEFR